MKELSIEEKAKAYDMALENAKHYHSEMGDDICCVLEECFPELKESEDEKIRKKLISFVENWDKGGIVSKYTSNANDIKQILAWLEKQGNNLVKNGYTKNKDYIRYADKYSYDIWRKLMDNFKNIKDYHIGCNEVSDIVLNAIIDTFNWLEKGGDKNKVSKHVEAINEEKVDDANKVEPKDYSSIDPHFGKTTDKVEPKFHEGEWVVYDGWTTRILKVTHDGYVNNKQGFIPKEREDCMRLWDITKDAKDGDVLACNNGWTCIFKTLVNDENFSSYCFMDNTKWFCETGSECHTLKEEFVKVYNGKLYPATKEQRDTFERAMADAGYAFDFDKKELKKIEKPIEWSYEDEANLNNIIWLCNNCIKGTETTWIPSQATKIKHLIETIKEKGLVQQNPAWSEEDEKTLERVIRCIENHDYMNVDDIHWLKSLKGRVQPQPKQEWSEDDETRVESLHGWLDTLINYIHHDAVVSLDLRRERMQQVEQLKTWLKSLKERIGG